MKIYSAAISIGVFAIVLYSCFDKLSNDNDKDKINFRLLPCDYLTVPPDKKPLLLRLYAVDTYKDSADEHLINKVDSFMCQAKDSINLKSYSHLVIRFLKETTLTRGLKNNSITDSHNPVSSEHFSFLQYEWDENQHFF